MVDVSKYGVRTFIGDRILVARFDKQANECVYINPKLERLQAPTSRSEIIDTDDAIRDCVEYVKMCIQDVDQQLLRDAASIAYAHPSPRMPGSVPHSSPPPTFFLHLDDIHSGEGIVSPAGDGRSHFLRLNSTPSSGENISATN